MAARSVVAFVIRGLGAVTAHTNAAATRLERDGAVYRVTDAAGRVHEADHVVLALPPYAAGPLAAQLAGTGKVAAGYARFPCLPAKLALHHDPAYMPKSRDDWSGSSRAGSRTAERLAPESANLQRIEA